MYTCDPASSITALGFLIFLVLLGLGIYHVTTNSTTRTRRYRKELVDMYVVGKTKQIAAKEGIDLLKEFKEFTKINKQKNVDYDALDTTIEKELQEKISKDSEEKLK